MKLIDADKQMFDNALGLSCLENYTLYILMKHECSYRFLYGTSFIQIFDIAKAINDEGIPYAYFNKIPRLHDTSHKEGLIQLSIYYDFQEAISQDSHCCIKITPSYVKDRYGREFWRDDHFLLLCNREDDSWICLNDNPRDIIEIRTEELPNVYAGQVICIDVIKKTFNDPQKKDFLDNFQWSINESHKLYNFSLSNFETARNILGIMRVTRKRIREYCSIYIDSSFMQNYIMKLDKTYVMMEYMRLHNRTDFDKINIIFEEIQTEDLQIIDKIKKNMELIR